MEKSIENNGLENGLVSVISPCFNGETYLARFLDSLLAQTYPNVELILVNDGSTDRTEQIALSYAPLFKKKGYRYVYLVQENRGQASALNQGLKLFRGEFLTWPDSDDALTPNALSVKVDYMNRNPQWGGVVCGVESIDHDTGAVLDTFMRYEPDEPPRQLFWDYFHEQKVVWCPGAYFLRSSCFLAANPARHIFENREGQNNQMLLPVLYHYPFGYIDQYLYHYYMRLNSHSNYKRTAFEWYVRKTDTQAIYTNTVIAMPCTEEERRLLYDEIIRKFLPVRMRFAAKAFRFDLLARLNRAAKRHHIPLGVRGKAVSRGVLAGAYRAVRTLGR